MGAGSALWGGGGVVIGAVVIGAVGGLLRRGWLCK